MKKTTWQYWCNPRTKKFDAQCHKNGHVLFFSRQGYENKEDCLKAIRAASGFWCASTQVEFKDRLRSRK
jgi:hypothetical protein